MLKQIIAVGGGKGGVGKSLIAANLAICIAQTKKRVILVDVDLGGANMHTLFGIDRPTALLEHFISRKAARLDEIVMPTGIANLSVICGGMPVLGSANPMHSQKMKLIRHMMKLDADVIVLDIGAGIGFNELDLFNAAEYKLVAFTPQLTSLHNGYGFLKSAIHRSLERIVDRAAREYLKSTEPETGAESLGQVIGRLSLFSAEEAEKARSVLAAQKIFLVGNMIRSPKEHGVVGALGTMIRDHLMLEAPLLGVLRYGEKIQRSVNERRPYMVWAGIESNAETFRAMAHKLIREHGKSVREAGTQVAAPPQPSSSAGRSERRDPRFPISNVTAFLNIGDEQYVGHIRNVAYGGTLIEFDRTPVEPATGKLVIKAENSVVSIEVLVEERHRDPSGRQIGFSFVDIKAETRKSIIGLVATAAATVAISSDTGDAPSASGTP